MSISWDSMYLNEYSKCKGLFWGSDPDQFVIYVSRLMKGRLPKGARILDIGCGEGRHCFYLAKEGFTAYGIDVARVAVKRGAEWTWKEHLQSKPFLGVGKSPELPYRLGSFDAVLDFHTMEFVHDKEGHIEEIARILRPEGMLFIRAGKPPSKGHYINPRELRRWLKGCFKVKYWDAPPDKGAIQAIAQRIQVN